MTKYVCPDCPEEFEGIGPTMEHREETGHNTHIKKRQTMNDTNRPLVGYVVLESDYLEDRDEPIHTFVSSPFATREEAERERDSRKAVYEEFAEDEGELYDSTDFSVQELHVHSLSQLTPMNEERYKTMTEATNAVAAGLLLDEAEQATR